MSEKVPAPHGVLSRYLAGGTWMAYQAPRKGKSSQTPGSKKAADTCQLTPVGGIPRKAFMRSRSYKLGKAYTEWCRFTDKLKGNSKNT